MPPSRLRPPPHFHEAIVALDSNNAYLDKREIFTEVHCWLRHEYAERNDEHRSKWEIVFKVLVFCSVSLFMSLLSFLSFMSVSHEDIPRSVGFG